MSNNRKKEFTQNIVSNLKQKISEFKNKKEHERAERKNELDFEINKDLVNQFKKNHTESLASGTGNPTLNLQNLIKNEKQGMEQPNPISQTKSKINNLAYNLKGNLDSSSNSIEQQSNTKQNYNSNNDALNFDFDLKNIRKSNTNTYNNYQSNKNPSKYGLNSGLSHSRDNSEERNRNSKVESKKVELMNSLINKDVPKKSYPISSKPSLGNRVPYPSISGGISSYTSTKDKIKDFVYKLDDKKNSPVAAREYKIPKYNFNSNTVNDRYTPSFPSRTAYVSSGYNKKQNNNDLDGFADFSIRDNKKDTSFTKQRTFSSDNLNFEVGLKSSKKVCPINSSDVRALSSKIRFLSIEDIKQMDRILIDELISLSNVIKRTFVDNK